MKQRRTCFTVQISRDLQEKMQVARKTQGVNWGFVLRNAIAQQLGKAEAKAATA